MSVLAKSFGLAALSFFDDLDFGHLDDDGAGAADSRLTGETQADHLRNVAEVHELLRTEGRDRVTSSNDRDPAESTRCDPAARRRNRISVRLKHLEKVFPFGGIERDVARGDADFGVHGPSIASSSWATR